MKILNTLILGSLLVGCQIAPPAPTGPTLKETTDWMANALHEHYGQRNDLSAVKDIVVKAKLTADDCKLSYELTTIRTIKFDLSDVDSNTIKIEKIGDYSWVTFRMRDYHKSFHYIDSNPTDSYDQEGGGFSLDSSEVAASFQKAFTRAVTLCGGKPSTF